MSTKTMQVFEALILQKKPRILSLDVFRGLMVCLMIVVNAPGTGAEPYPWLVHAEWFGFTLADLVFPAFLFAVGNAMSFALPPDLPNTDFLLKVLKRVAVIFLLGYLMYWYPFIRSSPDGSWVMIPIDDTRIMGVLQRIALCYGLAALAARYLSGKGLLALCVVLLIGYWAILMGFGAPGQQLTRLGYVGTRLDLLMLGKSHLYRKDSGFDPEGILATLPAVINVLAGYLAGDFIKKAPDSRTTLKRVLAAGAALVALALVWGSAFPISKKLWTSSYVVLTVGLDLIILAALIELIEVRKHRFGVQFFRVFGRNPLAIYLFSEIFLITLRKIYVLPGTDVYEWIGESLFQTMAPGPLGSLLCAVSYMLVCWGLGWLMDWKGVVIKI
jgi:alpha-N-acetylglucosaminidase